MSAHNVHTSIRGHLIFGTAAVVVAVLAIGVWAFTVTLSGAVISHGTMVVESYVKKVQHPTGGVVGQVNVKDGDHVKQGDILIKLDSTQVSAQLAIVTKRLDELLARQARLEAERDGGTKIIFDESLIERSSEAHVSAALRSETRLFEFRREARDGKKSQLLERIIQFEHEIEGLEAQRTAYDRGLAVLNSEIASLRPLLANGFVNAQRLNALETQAATFGGERGEKIAYKAQAGGRIAETRLQILSIEHDLKTEVGQELREIQAQIGEFAERKIAAEDELKRVDIVAPQSGFVHQLTAHTVGGVISPADVIMQIVPDNDQLVVEAQVRPDDIDQIMIGQRVLLRLTAFSQRTTPELSGNVLKIGAELTHDEKSGKSWYIVRVMIPDTELIRLGELKLIAGMPIEILIQTGDRTAISYLMKPLADQMYRAFKEQ
ncbi:HlyD family type I secretion periplasmic adaptor subunit [Brucella pituitosa]